MNATYDLKQVTTEVRALQRLKGYLDMTVRPAPEEGDPAFGLATPCTELGAEVKVHVDRLRELLKANL